MIVTTCPLRISLVGGSTDHPWFIEKYGAGSVISFASNLKTYVTIHKDVFGANALDKKYILNYSIRESVETIDEIKNDIIRHCFKEMQVDTQINCSLTSDIFSAGSGLAASSAYVMALVSAICEMRGIDIDEMAICKIAQQIETEINPLVGPQDFYGSIGGLKKITFNRIGNALVEKLNSEIFNHMNCYLIYTGVLRKSTTILEKFEPAKALPLLRDVGNLQKCIDDIDINGFNDVINMAWEKKKNVSPHICENPILIELDNKLKLDKNILSHKLCGAGNGGYYLVFTKTDSNMLQTLKNEYTNVEQIYISPTGMNVINLKKII